MGYRYFLVSCIEMILSINSREVKNKKMFY